MQREKYRLSNSLQHSGDITNTRVLTAAASNASFLGRFVGWLPSMNFVQEKGKLFLLTCLLRSYDVL